ncbi:MAG: histidinol dehydrogenase [Chloroflexi bacterium]|nr:histidinol dehydrogenase [Chloroflexota bacterium]
MSGQAASGGGAEERALAVVEGAEAARAGVLRRRPLASPELPAPVRERIREVLGEELDAASCVARIIADVEREGDAAVVRYSRAFDGSAEAPLEVTRAEIATALEETPPDLLEALRFMTERVRRFHELQLDHGPKPFTRHGLGMRVTPLASAGIYMAGSVAVLPSSVIHTAVPAAVAGVGELVGATAALPDGSVHPLKLAAAELAGVSRVVRASGAQAIAALALGTESIPRVDIVVGPGNLFVTLAKQQLYGRVGIDSLYGPTETLVLSDGSAAADLVAADLLAQAEHDALATPILITTDREQARAVAEEVDRQLPSLEREAIARAAIGRGGAVVAADLEQALALANEFAPEHLCLLTREPERLAPLVTSAGGLFLGETTPEVIGDYTAGPSHVMPTGGSARFASPLTVLDFLRVTSTVALSESDVYRLGTYAATLARAEGLTAHARAVELRLEGR